MAAKTLATYISELSAVTSLGAGDKLPVLESSTVKYVDGANVGGAVAWGAITGTLANQTDLNTALGNKQASDADLTAIAGLTPADDDLLQRKSGAWANRTVAQVKTDLGVPTYARYVALLTQTGTDAPVATVLENTLGGTVVWSYGGAGEYVGTLAGAFTENKTWFAYPNTSVNSQSQGLQWLSVDTIGLNYDSDYNGISYVEIRAYP